MSEVQSADNYPSRCFDEPRILPRRDPVVWSTQTENEPLDDIQTASYDRNGYVVVKDLFTAHEINTIKAAADESLTSSAIDPTTVITEPGSDEIRSIFEIHRQHQLIGKLIRDNRLVSIARFLLGDSVYVHQSRLNYKPGFEGREFYWHSDFETWHVEDGMPRMRALSMSLLLTDNLVCNGPLMLINGSHRHYVACVGETPQNHFKQSLRKQEYGVPDPASMSELAKQGIHTVVAPAGSLVIFDCNVLHGSGSNISPYPRSNLFFVYNALSNQCVVPFGNQPPRPQHIANRTYIEPL